MRLRARTAVRTWAKVGALLPANPQQPLSAKPLQEPLEEQVFGVSFDQTGAELGQHAGIKTGMVEGQRQQVPPVNACPNRICCAFVAEALGELHQGNQSQTGRRGGGAAFGVKEKPKVVTVEHVTERIAQREGAVARLKDGLGHTGGVFRHLAGAAVFQAHTQASSRHGTPLVGRKLSKPAASKVRMSQLTLGFDRAANRGSQHSWGSWKTGREHGPHTA